MSTSTKKPRRRLRRGARVAEAAAAPETATLAATAQSPVEIAPNDPLLAYLQSAGGAVDVDALELDSDAVRELKAAGVKLAIPLVSQGELIGVLNLGARLSEQEYSSDDRRLLDNLAGQAAPALRVGQLVREQEAEAVTRQRYEQELEVARLIQSHFLPKTLPDLPGLADRGLLPARPRGRRRLLRRDPAARRPVRLRRRRRDRQGRARGAGDVGDPQPAARGRAAADRARRGAGAGQRAAVPRHAREDVRHLPLRRPRPRRPATSASPTPATTCPTSRPRTASSSCARGACRSG